MTNLSDIDLGIYSYKDEHEQKYNYCIDAYAKRVLAKLFSAEEHLKDVKVFVLGNNVLRLNGSCQESKIIFDNAGLNLTADDLLKFNEKVTKALTGYSGKYVNYVLLPEYDISNSVFNDPVIHDGEFDVAIKFKAHENKNSKKSTKKSVNE